MQYRTETDCIQGGRDDSFRAPFLYEKKEEANGKAVVLHLYHYLRPEEKFEDVEELKCQIEEDIWEGKRHFLLTMESRRALLESETKKQKKN